MRAKIIKFPTWEELNLILPNSIKKIFQKLEQIKEDPQWHPESDALEHIKIVYNRALESMDADIIMCALFHDLGKVLAAKEKTGGFYSSHGHEKISSSLVNIPLYKKFIKDFGADPENVLWLVENHMRFHNIEEMRLSKRKILMEHPLFDKLEAFGIIDKMY